LAGQHGLSGADLAAALDVSVNHANALLSRARQQFEKSLSALVVARTGREACAVLDDLLHGWDGRMTPLLRKRIARHIEACDTCGENKRRRVNAKQLLAVIPLLVAGGEITDQVTQENADPELVSYRRGLADRAGPYRRDGFPVGQSRTRRPPWITIAAVAALLLMLGIYALVPRAADRREALPPTPSTSSVGSLPATVSVSVPDSITTTVDTTTVAPATTTTIRIVAPPRQTVVVTTTTTTTQPPSSSSPSPSSSQPPSSSRPPVGTFGVTPREVDLNPGKAAVTLSAKGGSLSWQAVSSNPHVTVNPSSGSLTSGQTVSVSIVLATFDNSGGARIVFTPTGGPAVTVSASWTVIS
jgi:hypothetical protein